MISCWSRSATSVVGARDHGGGRKAERDLLGVVRAGEHGDRRPSTTVESRRAGRRVEPLRQAEDRRRRRRAPDDLPERAARNRERDDLRLGERRVLDVDRAKPPRSTSGR